MQRINWFPDPLFKGAKPSTTDGCRLTFANGVASFIGDTNTSQGTVILATVSGLTSGAEYVFSGRCYVSKISQRTVNGDVFIYSDSTNYLASYSVVAENRSEEFLVRFIAPSDGKIKVGMHVMQYYLCALRIPSIELASTYGSGVGGGASGLLLGGHDATRLRRSVGRVMSDDGHEPDKQSKSPRHAEAGRVHADFDHREYSGYHILGHGLAGRVGRLHHVGQLSGHLQQEPTHRMVLHVPEHESDEPDIQGRVRQSDRQCVEHGHVRAGRIPGEQGLARRPLLFRRGYDATRLTLLGVVA